MFLVAVYLRIEAGGTTSDTGGESGNASSLPDFPLLRRRPAAELVACCTSPLPAAAAAADEALPVFVCFGVEAFEEEEDKEEEDDKEEKEEEVPLGGAPLRKQKVNGLEIDFTRISNSAKDETGTSLILLTMLPRLTPSKQAALLLIMSETTARDVKASFSNERPRGPTRKTMVYD